MTSAQIPKLRKLLLAGSFVALPAVGFLWAVDVRDYHAPGVIILFLLAMVTALGAEILAAMQERRTAELESELARTRAALEEVSSGCEERVRELDRIIDTLSERNADLRATLLHEKTGAGERQGA